MFCLARLPEPVVCLLFSFYFFIQSVNLDRCYIDYLRITLLFIILFPLCCCSMNIPLLALTLNSYKMILKSADKKEAPSQTIPQKSMANPLLVMSSNCVSRNCLHIFLYILCIRHIETVLYLYSVHLIQQFDIFETFFMFYMLFLKPNRLMIMFTCTYLQITMKLVTWHLYAEWDYLRTSFYSLEIYHIENILTLHTVYLIQQIDRSEIFFMHYILLLKSNRLMIMCTFIYIQKSMTWVACHLYAEWDHLHAFFCSLDIYHIESTLHYVYLIQQFHTFEMSSMHCILFLGFNSLMTMFTLFFNRCVHNYLENHVAIFDKSILPCIYTDECYSTSRFEQCRAQKGITLYFIDIEGTVKIIIKLLLTLFINNTYIRKKNITTKWLQMLV